MQKVIVNFEMVLEDDSLFMGHPEHFFKRLSDGLQSGLKEYFDVKLVESKVQGFETKIGLGYPNNATTLKADMHVIANSKVF